MSGRLQLGLKIAFITGALLMLGASPAKAVGTNRITMVEVNRYWFNHLTFELYRSEANYPLQEAICRRILEVDPKNKPALQALHLSFLEREEAILADAVKAYSAIVGVDAVVVDPVRLQTQLATLKRVSVEEDILWKSWYELYVEDLKKFKKQFNEPVFNRMESRIRKYTVRSSQDLKVKLLALVRLHEERKEKAMVAVLLNYLNVTYPFDLDLLVTAINAMQAVGLNDAVNGLLRNYREQQEIPQAVANFLARECLEQGLYADTIVFARRWRDLDEQNPVALRLEGEALYELNRYEEAIGPLLAATKLEGHNPRCYETLARIYCEFGEQNQTELWLDRLRPSLSDQEIVDLLIGQPFKRMPNLMLRLVK